MSEQEEENVLFEEVYHPCFLWTLILAPCCLPVVWNYHVRVTDSELSIGYSSGCASLTVDRSQILTVEALEDVRPLLDWGGWGIRKQLPSWDTGYIPKRGPGVRMEIQGDNGKKYAYTFICMDAEACVTALST